MRRPASALAMTRGSGRIRLRAWSPKLLSAAGIPVALANKVTPTPELSFAVRGRKAAGGVMITSSHNPAEWNGVKYKASYGGSGSPAIIASIESYLEKPLAAGRDACAD